MIDQTNSNCKQETIHVGDLCSIEDNAGNYHTGRCWYILENEIVFLVGGKEVNVWRGLAEQNTILLEKYERESLIAQLTEELAAVGVA